MILRDLLRLAEREKLTPPDGFWREKISWVVVLQPDGTIERVDHLEEGKQWLWLPIRVMNEQTPSGPITKGEWIFGWEKIGEMKKNTWKDVKQKGTDFLKQRRLYSGLLNQFRSFAPDDHGLRAVRTCLLRVRKDPSLLGNALRVAQATVESKYRFGTVEIDAPDWAWEGITFRVMDDPHGFVFMRPALIDAWQKIRDIEQTDSLIRQCLVSGEQKRIVRKFPSIRLGGKPESLISVAEQQESFQHYGNKMLENAPVGIREASQVSIAIERLISDGDFYPYGQNKVLGKRHYSIGGTKEANIEVLYWCEPEDGQDPLGDSEDPWYANLVDFDAATPEDIKAILERPWRDGKRRVTDLTTPFHALLISRVNKSRFAIRGIDTRPIGEVAQSVQKWFEDLKIDPFFQNNRVDIGSLIDTVKSPKDKSEPPPDLSANLYLCAIDQKKKFPGSLLAQILNRIRCHDGVGDLADLETRRRQIRAKKGENITITDARAALLKAYLNRNLHKEILVSLDPNYPEPAYQLGRLFSLLEKIQDEANPGINAGIADRFLGSAMGAPSLVFPRLLKLSRHHLGKMQEKGLVTVREKQMDEILGRFNAGGLPRTQTLEQQGVFILGYHHQRAKFFEKKDETVQATA